MKDKCLRLISRAFFANSPHITALFLGEHNCFVPYILLVIGISFFSALIEGSSFGLLMLSLSLISSSEVPHLAFFPWINHLNKDTLFTLIVLSAIVMQGIKSLLSYLNAQLVTHLALKMQTTAQLKVYEHILNFDFTTINQYKVGALTELARSPTTLFQPYLSSIRELILNVCTILTYFALMLFLSFPLTCVTLISATLILCIQKIFLRFINTESTKTALAIQSFGSHTTENLNGIRTIFTFNRQAHTLQQSKTTLDRIAYYSKTMSRYLNTAVSVNEFLSIILVGSLLILAYFLLEPTGTHALSAVTAFMGIAYRLATRLPMINGSLASLSTKRGDCLLLADLFNEEGKTFRLSKGTPFTHFKHSITFDQVSFTYPHTSQVILKNISLKLNKGTITALVGHSGAGKSTLIDLLSGLYAPLKGRILIDHIDLQTYALDSWRSHLGIVSQDVFIFNSSIADNIRYGKLEASDEEVILAATQAGAHLFIQALKDGYETLVGEKGYTLSGGEKQRLSLARTLLRDPEILILDEATSNLDSESERIIQDSINTFHHKKTLIIIAHRLSTIKKADQILVLDQGSLVEQGNHFTLLELQGKYAKFWNLQTQHASTLGSL